MSTATVMPPPAPSGPALAAAIGRLRADADTVRELLAGGALRELPDAAAASVTVELAGVVESVTAARSVGLARVVDSGYAEVEGFVSTYSWWASKTRMSRDAAADQVRLAKRLGRHYPATGAAWTAGAATGEHAAVIATGVDAVLHHMKRALRRDATETGQALDPVVLQATAGRGAADPGDPVGSGDPTGGPGARPPGRRP